MIKISINEYPYHMLLIVLDTVIDQLYISNVITRKAYKFELKPYVDSKQKLAQNAGCVRLVWSKVINGVKENLDNKEGWFLCSD